MRWRQRERTAPGGAPVLSVVVPAYGVEAYLDDCFRSILGQSLRDIEVIVVDDGSPDRSGAIAGAWAARDPRVHVVTHAANQGLSAARNTGVAAARAPYLTFVDADDTLPPDAWALAIRALEQSGSDFTVGRAVRVTGSRQYVGPLMARNHRETRLGLTLDEAPLMLADVFAWNKVFRRSFWDRAGLAFPPGLLYEDQPAMTEAFLAARTFDVLADDVYHWSVRENQSSLSQRRGELRNVRDRRTTKLMTLDSVRAAASPAVLEVLLREILPIDMWEHYRAAVTAGPEYWQELRGMQCEIWNDDSVAFAQVALPTRQRLMGVLVDQDRLEDLATLVAWIDAGAEGPMPYADDPTIPPAVFG